MRFNLTEIVELIKERRSIAPELYKDRKVHKEQIELMLDAANWAPNHGQTEPWRFIVFSDESLKQLMSVLAEEYKKNTPPDQFLSSKYERFIKRGESVSYVIAICMKRQESQRIPESEELMAVACAVQNMSLVATAYGMGAFWSSGKVIDSPDLMSFLELNAPDRCLGFLYVGYPAEEWPKGKRGIWMNKVIWRS